jgi:hypothetical protein
VATAGRASFSTEIDPGEFRAFKKAVRDARPDSPEWSREFARVNKAAAMVIVADAQARALGYGPETSTAARAIKGVASTTDIKVTVSGGAGVPWALAGIWGSDKHSGWYARPRYANSSRQHPTWVGNSWEVGGAGGPRAVNPAIAAKVDDLMKQWADAIGSLMDAFADR